MNSFIAEVPRTITISLKGGAKDAQESCAGTYILGPNQVRGKPHWLQEGGSNALWYKEWHGTKWNVGPEEVNGNIGVLYSPDDSVSPTKATNWEYWSSGKKFIAANELIAVIPGTFDNVSYSIIIS